MSEGKPGWRRVKFGEVVRQVKDRVDPATSGLTRYVAGEHMDSDDLRIRRWGDIGDDYLGPAFHMRFRPGHVLYGSRRTYLRKVAVADFEGICANTTFVLESLDPKVLLPELLPFIMQTEAFHEHSKRESKGSVNPYVNFSDLAWYEFALPPMEEQRRIAAFRRACEEVEQALRELEAGASGLRRSMLADHLPSLPGCVPTRLSDISRVVRGSTPRPAGDPRFFNGSDVPWITVGEITGSPSAYLDSTATWLTVEGAQRSRHLTAGTVVLSNSGWTLGVPKILRIDGCANDGVAAFLDLDSRVLPEFLYHSLARLTDYFRNVVAAGGDQPNLNTARIGAVEILLPPIQAQLAFLAQMRDVHSAEIAATQRATVLRQMSRHSGVHP